MGGKKAQEIGAGFEEIFCNLSRYQGFHVERIPDACKQISANKFIREKSPFDYILVKDFSFVAFIDCKTVEGRTFKHSRLVNHQLQSLRNIGRHGLAGYIVWFRKPNIVNFFDWQKLTALCPGKSVSDSEGISLGKIEDFRLSRLIDEYRIKSNANGSTKNKPGPRDSLF